MRPKMAEGKTLAGLGLVFGGIGLMLSLVGVIVSTPRLILAQTGAVADGEVVAIQTGSKNSKRPVVEFKPKGKKRVRFTATVGNSASSYSIGERVKVFYDPSDPSDALLDSFTEIWFFPILFNGMGTMWLAMGLPCLFLGRARQKARERVRSEGQRAQGVVVEVTKRVYKSTARYTPIVEAIDPSNGAKTRFIGEERYDAVAVGRPATVHFEAQPPHRYFVDV